MSKVQKQCIFATHLPSSRSNSEDMLLVKERIKDETGKEYSEVRLIPNFKRKYYVTKKGKRDHLQKRDHEALENLDEFSCTQANLAAHAYKTLHGYHSQNHVSLPKVAISPWLYGADIPSTSIIKDDYAQKYPDYNPKATSGVMDFETDVVNGNGKDIIIGIFTFQNNIYISATRDWLGTLPDPEALFRAGADKVLPIFLEQLRESVTKGDNAKWGEGLMKVVESKILNLPSLKIQFDISENEYTCAKFCMDAAKHHLPDNLVFWNMKADIGFMENACKKHNKFMGDLLAYDKVPKEFIGYYFKEDQLIKKKANGDTMSKDFIDLWHGIRSAAPFQFVDAMSFYHLNRKMSIGKLNNYKLESILMRELGLGKLYSMVDCGEDVGSYNWHRIMQTKHKLAYMLYAIFDGLMVEILDAKTGDLGVSLPTYLERSDLSKATSNPRRNADSDHFFYLREKGRVICTTSSNMTGEFDHLLPSTRDIIITLPAERVVKTGRSFVFGISDDRSRWSFHCGDIDLASSYPTTTIIFNAAPGTTRIEVLKIGNMSELELKQVAVDLTASKVNGVKLCREIYKMPTLTEALKHFAEAA